MIPSSISFTWRKCKDIPQGMKLYGLPVFLNGTVYVRGESEGTATVCVYTPGCDMWDMLPPPPLHSFIIATLKHQLVLVGGVDSSTDKVSNTITVWDSQSQQLVQPYPPMVTARTFPAAVGYGVYLIVAGGCNSENERIPDVNILDTTSSKWLTAESLPSTAYWRSILIEDTLYLVSYNTRVVLRAHVPTLISQAMHGCNTYIISELVGVSSKYSVLLGISHCC